MAQTGTVERVVAPHGPLFHRRIERAASKVFAEGDVVVVVLEETFTPAERTLISQGQSEGIQDIRRNFQSIMADQFKSLVEQATGREVRSFTSDTDLENDIAVEVFILGDQRTDLSSFEGLENPAEQ